VAGFYVGSNNVEKIAVLAARGATRQRAADAPLIKSEN
jgi:hypothetical protein